MANRTALPDQIAAELKKLDERGIPYRIDDAKVRRLIYVDGEFAAPLAYCGSDLKTRSSMRNALAGIQRVARKNPKYHLEPTNPRQMKETTPMTQSQEYAALAGRIGNVEQLAKSLLEAMKELTDTVKIGNGIADNIHVGVELLLEADKQKVIATQPSMPKGWLRDAIMKLMDDGEKRHVFEVWKALVGDHPALSEASVNSTLADLADDMKLKRARLGIYFAEKDGAQAAA